MLSTWTNIQINIAAVERINKNTNKNLPCLSENPASLMRYGIAAFVPVAIASVGYRRKSLDFSGLLTG